MIQGAIKGEFQIFALFLFLSYYKSPESRSHTWLNIKVYVVMY